MSQSNQSPPDERPPLDEEYVVAELAVQQPAAVGGVSEPLRAELLESPRIRRRRKLPLILFLLTCASTCFAGATGWVPLLYYLGEGMLPLRRAILVHWQDGLVYMVCVLGILLTHEMGHFMATVKYRIPASFPFFLPLPLISPFGTLGAVIAMDGRQADRRQTFDIGLAGPLAGLLVTVPMLWIGIKQLDPNVTPYGYHLFQAPLAIRLILGYAAPAGYQASSQIMLSQLNPYLMAGCVGLLITGLNMLPVSQLDGGHVIHTLFGRRGRWISRGVILLGLGHVVWYAVHQQLSMLTLMVVILLLIGPDHPPTRDDSVPLGWFRTVLGWLCLLIPVFCFPPDFL
ncbi:MAG: site-2 protease family protein [Planctomycetota bacterium]|nr:site-2 protease family protein [Planctomycetota bacterium]